MSKIINLDAKAHVQTFQLQNSQADKLGKPKTIPEELQYAKPFNKVIKRVCWTLATTGINEILGSGGENNSVQAIATPKARLAHHS